MCHIILFLPVLALPVFWLLPLSLAAPIYLATLLFSGWMYYAVYGAMHRPKRVGPEALLNRRGRVIRTEGHRSVIRLGNEIWNARSQERLGPGDGVVVVGRTGLTLRVSLLSGSDSVRLIAQPPAACRGGLPHRRRHSVPQRSPVSKKSA